MSGIQLTENLIKTLDGGDEDGANLAQVEDDFAKKEWERNTREVQEDEAEERVKAFKPTYQVTPELMEKAGKQALFMHCLPASRNVEVYDEVIDSDQSIAFEQAENRLTAQMGLLVYYLYPQIDKSSNAVKDYYRGKVEAFMEHQDRSWKQRYTYNNDYAETKNKK